MIIGNLNGTSIIDLPSQPGFSDITIVRRNTIGVNTSPFSMQSRFLEWPGADIIMGHAVLPPMLRSDAAEWESFFAECKGQLNGFLLPLPFDGKRLPGGAPNLGSPVVNGNVTNTPGTMTLASRGWTPNSGRLLLRGDYVQVGYRIYMLTAQVASDANGLATLSITPSLREAPGDGTAIVVHNPHGLCRMAGNDVQVSIDANGLYHLEFNWQEVR